MAIPCVVVSNVRVIDIGLDIGEQSKVEIEPSGCIDIWTPMFMLWGSVTAGVLAFMIWYSNERQ